MKTKSENMQGVFLIKEKVVVTSRTMFLIIEGEDSSIFSKVSIGEKTILKKMNELKEEQCSEELKFIIKDVEVDSNIVRLELSIYGEKDPRAETILTYADNDEIVFKVKSLADKHSMQNHVHHSHHENRHANHKMKFIHGEFDPEFLEKMKKYKHKSKSENI